MAIIQAILGFALKSVGRVLNMAFGWATMMLFGKVSQKRQYFLSVITLGSVLWIFSAIGIAFPRFAAFALAFVTLPDWVNDNWIRLGMLIAALILPAVIGGLTIFMVDPSDRPAGVGGKVKAVLKGYPYTLGLALTVLFMTVVAPVLKVRDIARRWTGRHIPVVVEPDDYKDVVLEVKAALASRGVETRSEPAAWPFQVPVKIMTFFAGKSVRSLVANTLTTLVAKDLNIVLYPSDLVISGPEHAAAHAHAVVTEQLVFSKAYLTATKEANEIEDRLRRIWLESRQASDRLAFLPRLRAIEKELRSVSFSYEEWEVLFRGTLIVEKALHEGSLDTATSFELVRSPRPVGPIVSNLTRVRRTQTITIPLSKPRGAAKKATGTAGRVLSVGGGAALVTFGLKHSGLTRILAVVGGAVLLRRGVSGGSPERVVVSPPLEATRSLTIERPAGELYNFWRALTTLPLVLAHVKQVEVLDPTHSRWTVLGPHGPLTLGIEVVDDRLDEGFSWQSLPGGYLEVRGSVAFTAQPEWGGTVVTVRLRYAVPRGTPRGGKILRDNPARQLPADLRHWKAVMEAGVDVTALSPAG